MDPTSQLSPDEMQRIFETCILGIVAIMVILFVVRPLISKAVEPISYNSDEPEYDDHKETNNSDTGSESLRFQLHMMYVDSLKSVSDTYRGYLIRKDLD